MKRFRIIIECQTPESSDDSCAHAYASNVRDYIHGSLFVAGVGYQLGVTDVRYEFAALAAVVLGSNGEWENEKPDDYPIQK